MVLETGWEVYHERGNMLSDWLWTGEAVCTAFAVWTGSEGAGKRSDAGGNVPVYRIKLSGTAFFRVSGRV